MKYPIFIAATLIILSSCERETQIKVPPHVPKLVAECMQGQNSFPDARISHTRGVTDPLPRGGQANPYVVKNATVLLYEDDVLKDSLRYNTASERYKASIARIQAGKKNKLAITAPNYPAHEAINFIPV